MRIKETCSVGDQFCEAAANHEDRKDIKGVCFVCGQSVCLKCSSKRQYLHYGKVRICNECQISELDNGDDGIVMKRMNKLVCN